MQVIDGQFIGIPRYDRYPSVGQIPNVQRVLKHLAIELHNGQEGTQKLVKIFDILLKKLIAKIDCTEISVHCGDLANTPEPWQYGRKDLTLVFWITKESRVIREIAIRVNPIYGRPEYKICGKPTNDRCGEWPVLWETLTRFSKLERQLQPV